MVGQKYDRRAKNKKYTTPCPIHGMWGSRKTSWDGQANNNKKKQLKFFGNIQLNLSSRTAIWKAEFTRCVDDPLCADAGCLSEAEVIVAAQVDTVSRCRWVNHSDKMSQSK